VIHRWGDILIAIEWGAFALFAAVIIAALYQALIDAVHRIFDLGGQPFALISRTMWAAVEKLGETISVARSHLAYPNEPNEQFGEASTWDIWAPLVTLIINMVEIVGEFSLSVLTFGATFGLGASANAPFVTHLDTTTGLLWAAVIMTYGLTLYELVHLSPLHRPYGQAEGWTRKILLGVSIVGIVLSMVALALFYLWRQTQLGASGGAAELHVFLVLFAMLIVGALVLSGWAVVVNLGVLKVVWLNLVRAITAGIAGCGSLAFRVLDGAYNAVVRLIGIPATLGRTCWNWFARTETGRRFGLREIDEPNVAPLAGDGSPILGKAETDPTKWTEEHVGGTTPGPGGPVVAPTPLPVNGRGRTKGTSPNAARTALFAAAAVLVALILAGGPLLTLSRSV
jgi:hypothetical protein